ncbi:undecaprenyldiphospho-muramoylpentapeptide beta-N-acetylglucosaminyltransferase [bacterium]|nr:undecaprenyldiphospho-muramoylpentapeptide beta-N-acetylglucosaminyltransferase [bacterium]
MRRLLVTGGGTGGHIYPALALARGFLAAAAPGEARAALFVGSRRGLEARLVPAAGIPFRALPMRGFRGKGPLERLLFLPELLVSVARALALLREFQPDAVLATGSFASLPVLIAARLARRPIFLQEQNSVPGRVSALFARRARTVFIAYPEAARRLGAGARCQLTGNPLREELLALAGPRPARAPGAPPRLLAFGGSRGAHSLNAALRAGLPLLARECRFEALIQTGEAERAETAAALAALAPAVQVAAYLDDMPARLAAADWVLCRAGAMTLAEITLLGLPALLVPYPHAVDDHQTANARALAEAGAALLIPDAELDGPRLAAALAALWRDPARGAAMAAASAALGRPRATADILAALEKSLAGPGGGC